MHGWLNIYKPKGISSAKVVAIAKKIYKGCKVGHAGTLDVEAEGVLPLAIGEATKLMQYLIGSHKKYVFTVKFGAKTTTGDYSGQVIATTKHIPLEDQCHEICQKFIGEIEQIPPAFSAIKVNGVRSYKIARKDHNLVLPSRKIYIYHLECLNYNHENKSATYVTECSKGTYIRTLAEDIALSLQSLGFVIELRRIQVGVFKEEHSLNIMEFERLCLGDHHFLEKSLLRVETVLDDIPVLDVDNKLAEKIKFGQKVQLLFPRMRESIHRFLDPRLRGDDKAGDATIWIKYQGRLLAIGSIKDNCFNSSRVFNLINVIPA